MKKPYERLSHHAKKIVAVGQKLNIKFWGDPNWSIAEAVTLETPTGEVHLHWSSHRGKGHWNIITNPKWRGEICGTARCRRVILEPLGGENESANLGDKAFDEIRNEFIWSKWGAFCYWPRWGSEDPIYVTCIPAYQDRMDWEKPLRQKNSR